MKDVGYVLHSAVGLGIKIGLLMNLIYMIISALIFYFYGAKSTMIFGVIYIALALFRGAYFIGILKELYDKYVRKTKFDIADVRATQNSKIVLDFYERLKTK